MPHHQHPRHAALHQADMIDENLEKRDVKTVMSVVYVTASKTFDGPIAGYSTDMPPSALDTPVPSVADTPPPAIFPGPTTTAIPASVLAASSASSLAAKSSFESRMSAARNPTHGLSSSSSMSVGHAIHSTAASSSTSMSVGHAIHSTKASSSSAAFTNTGLEASAPTASQAQPTQESSSGGMSGGAKAGLAIGLILAIGLVLGLVFFCYRRRKSQTGHQKLDDEKSQMQQAPPPLIPRVSIRRPGRDDAPRLSLRPVTGLFPDSNTNEKQAMAGNNTTLQAPAAAHAKPTPWERSAALPSVTEASNPFGDHAELVGSAAGAGAIDAAAMPKPLNVSRPSTPTGQSSPSMQHAAPGSPGPAAGPGGPMNVHRVQLDFPPSMEDELELRAGQLVRMLHEYDDGWALCIRLDRSQQGVVPRSCISKLPVKPRPAGPPPPGARGPPPHGRPVRPGHSSMSSNGSGSPDPSRGGPRMRSQSNAPGPFGSGQYRSGPGPQQGRPRANTAQSSPRNSPPSGQLQSPVLTQGAMPSRKPVPGQAM